jgi:hypothetical protein
VKFKKIAEEFCSCHPSKAFLSNGFSEVQHKIDIAITVQEIPIYPAPVTLIAPPATK